MKHLKHFYLLLILTLGILLGATVNSCRKHVHKPLVIEHFPVQVGNSWEYRRIFSVIISDTVNHDTSEYILIDSLHEEFKGIDKLAGWECYRLLHLLFGQGHTYPKTRWYAHPDTALLWIACLLGDISRIVEGEKFNNKILWKGTTSFDSPHALQQYLYNVRYKKFLSFNFDTTYLSTPKKLFVFPLTINKYWVAMRDPWLEEREIIEEDSVTVPAGTFNSLRLEITSDWMEEFDLWHKWIADEGIIKDSLYLRGIATNAQGDTIGYFYSYDIYELLDFQTDTKGNYSSSTINY